MHKLADNIRNNKDLGCSIAVTAHSSRKARCHQAAVGQILVAKAQTFGIATSVCQVCSLTISDLLLTTGHFVLAFLPVATL